MSIFLTVMFILQFIAGTITRAVQISDCRGTSKKPGFTRRIYLIFLIPVIGPLFLVLVYVLASDKNI